MIQFPQANVVKELTAQAGLSNWFEPHGCLQSVVDMPAPGFVRQLMLGSSGLQIRHADRAVCIPAEVLFKLAEQLDPAFIPPTADQLKKLAENNQRLVS